MFADTVADQIVSDSQREWGTLPQNGIYIWQHTAHEIVQSGATEREQLQYATKNADDPKFKESHALDAPLPPDATGCNERRRRDSNPGWQICNPTQTLIALR